MQAARRPRHNLLETSAGDFGRRLHLPRQPPAARQQPEAHGSRARHELAAAELAIHRRPSVATERATIGREYRAPPGRCHVRGFCCIGLGMVG
jgi:hypothetical protein